MKYELRNRKGNVICTVEAESHLDARLYGIREVIGFDRAVELPEGDSGLAESWRALHPEWSEAQIMIATTGTLVEATVIDVPPQDSSPVFREGEKDADREKDAEIARWKARRSAEAAEKKRAVEEARKTRARKAEARLIVKEREEAKEEQPGRTQLEESWRAAHPEWSDEQIRIAVEG